MSDKLTKVPAPIGAGCEGNRVVSNGYGSYFLTDAEPKSGDNLMICYGGNGNYYIGTFDENTNRYPKSVVEVVGPGGGGGEKHQRVMLAIAELYRAMKERAESGG